MATRTHQSATPSRQARTSAAHDSTRDRADLVPAGSNLVVLRGLIRRDPEYRVLPSGEELLALDLTVRDGELPAESVPVVWHNPAAAAAKLVAGDDVVVIGRVKRRFFRAGGSTASRTEVHADKVLSARSGIRIRSLLEARFEELNL